MKKVNFARTQIPKLLEQKTEIRETQIINLRVKLVI